MQSLPIDTHLREITDKVRSGNLVLLAEPGAGKTTRVPPALARAFPTGQVLVVGPRRLAARLAAARVAEEASSRLGAFVGYRVRFEDVTSKDTRVCFATEGVALRQFTRDPEVRDVSVVILDEFHERHIDGDLTLALALALQRGPRPDLRVVVMSATIDAAPIASFLDAPVVTVPGRNFDVKVEHLSTPDPRSLDVQVASHVKRLTREGLDGDVLVFLPGAADIRRAKEACANAQVHERIRFEVLHGNLPAAAQDRALRRTVDRKIILATNVAETSITIETVTAVLDSGLARVSKWSPWSGLSSLVTKPISRASAIQRAGRAGRVRDGRCFRLFTKHDFDTRPAQEIPEIFRADLAAPFLLLRLLGHDPRTLAFFERPTDASLEAAELALTRLGAVDVAGKLTDLGCSLALFPAHPRLARVIVESARLGHADTGCLLAALLGEREIRLETRTHVREARAKHDTVEASDVLARLEAYEAAESHGFDPRALRDEHLDAGAIRSVSRAREQLERIARRLPHDDAETAETTEGALLRSILCGYPDRVAKRRRPHAPEVVFAGGGAGVLAPTSVVREAELMVVVEADERGGGQSLVRVASAIEPEWLLELFPDRVRENKTVRFDEARGIVERLTELTYDDLVLDGSRDARAPDETTAAILAQAALAKGTVAFTDPEVLETLRRRTAFAARHDDRVAAVTDDRIHETLLHQCATCMSIDELKKSGFLDALRASLGHEALSLLDRLAPERVRLGGGRSVAVHYEVERSPWIESRLQDFFGMAQGPSIADGKEPLVLHLLAPNHRAVQVTTDLAGFWDRHYPSIRKELMRRYPRHAWPEDPRTAQPPVPRRR